MRMKFGAIGVIASIAAGVGAANAADQAVAPVHRAPPPVILSDWSGFYIGVHGGYGWGGDTSFRYSKLGTPADFPVKQKGGLFGGHAGFNWQYGSVVAGLEVDFDGADIAGTEAAFGGAFKTSALASARARLGYTVLPNLLVYGTGGAAWGHTVWSNPIGGFDTDHILDQSGWTAGAGFEYKFRGNFVARSEYLHYDLGTMNFFGDLPLKETIDVVRGGVSYKF